MIEDYINFDYGDIEKLSSLIYDEGEDFGDEEVLITNGYDKIPNYLAQSLDIKLNTRVNMIDYSDEKVLISHGDGVLEADYVLVTVPLGVLRSKAIEFCPELPDSKIDAIQKIGINCTNKFLLAFDQIFWDKELFISFIGNLKNKFSLFININALDPKVSGLMTFAYADAARESETLSDEVLIE